MTVLYHIPLSLTKGRLLAILDPVDGIRDFFYERAFKYKHIVRLVLAAIVAAVVLVFYEFGLFNKIELLSLDYRFLLKASKPKPSPIVFIDMGEDSIEAIGRWPWPRKWHATLIKIISEYEPKAIAFDVLFSEPQDLLDDSVLQEALRQSENVYFPVLYNLKRNDPKYLHSGYGVSSVIRPLAAFERELKGVGHINIIPDSDGILRRVPALISYDDTAAYQLGLRVGLDALGIKDGGIVFDPARHFIAAKAPDGRPMRIPLDDNNELLINWQGRWGKDFRHYSYIDIVRSYAAIRDGKEPIVDLNALKGRICLVGLTAPGLTDIKPVPIQNAYPAVGINAMVLNSVLTGDFIRVLPKKYDIYIIIFISVLAVLCLSGLRIAGGMVLSIAGAAAFFIVSFAVFSFFNTAILTVYPIFAILLSYSMTSLYAQVIQSVDRARLFKQATRDPLTSLYNVRHFNLLLEAELKSVSAYKARRLSIIMADIDNFKHINDTYGHPAGDLILKEIAKAIQSRCREVDVVARYGGEEFIVMLTGAGEREASDVAEKIRQAVEAKKFRFKFEAYHATISVGVAEFSGEMTKEDLVTKADKALYKSKHEGKNRVSLYSSIAAA